MACINPDGTLSSATRKILDAMSSPTTLEDVAKETRLPLYRIRSSVREIVDAGWVQQTDGKYVITPAGQERLSVQA